jgi:Rod binding domain-containing protein
MHLHSVAHLTHPGGASAGAGQTAPNPKLVNPKLLSAAHQFEGAMMKELLKPMTEDDGLGGDDSGLDLGSGSGGALSEFASESLGQALSERGGFGIANRIISELSRNGNREGIGKVTHHLHPNTVMRPLE